MASRHKLIMLEGHLEGMGRKEECFVIAMRVSLQEPDQYEYAEASIHLAPEDLPDGPYTVEFEGRKGQVKLLDGRWWYAGKSAAAAVNF